MSNQRKTTHNQNTDDGFSRSQRFYLTLAVILTTIVLYAGYATLAGTNIATTLNLFGSGTTLNDGLVGHWTFDGEDISGQPSDDQSQWYDADWLYRVPITIQSSQVSANLTDFPVYVDLADLPAHFFSNVRSDGGDIRVTKNNGTTEVAREVVDIDTGGDTGEIHFNVDGTLSSSTDTTFYLYYGNASGTDYAIDAAYGAENVWTNDYVMVHHLNEGDSTTTDFYLDSTANDHDGTLVDADGDSVEVTSSQVGNAMRFEGDADSIDIDSLTASNIPTTGNVSLWVNRDTETVDRLLGIDDAFEYRLPVGGVVNYEFFHGGASAPVSSGGIGTELAFLSTNYVDGGTITGYINGVQDGTGTGNGTNPVGSGFSIGTRFNGKSDYTDGVLDEIRVSSSTRSADWISAEYVNQSTTTDFYSVGTNEANFLSSGRTALDRSENGNNGTLVNIDTSGVTPGPIGQALEFDGTDDKVEIPYDASFSGLPTLTVSAWVKLNALSGTQTLVNEDYGAFNLYYQDQSPDVFVFEVNTDNSGYHYNDGVPTDGAIETDRWYHVVGIFEDGQTTEVYIDGEDGTQYVTSPVGSLDDNGQPVYLGGDALDNYPLDGSLDDARLFDRVLTPDEIKQLYRQGATTKVAKTPEPKGPTVTLDDGLVGHWTLDSKDMDLFATSDQIIDRSSAGNDGDLIGMGSGTTTDRGVLGQSLLFSNGTFINIGSALPTSAYTKTAWIKMNGLGNGNNNIMSGGAADGHAFWVPSCKSYFLSSGHSGSSCAVGQWDDVQDSEALQFDQWYFVAVSYDSAESSGTMRLYRDGVEIDSATSISAPSSGTAYIATYGSGSALTFNGNLDDVRLYNRALTSDEIKQIYRQGATTKIATTPEPKGPTVTLDDGLVGHWTFDGSTMDVFASADQVQDQSSSNNDGDIYGMGAGTTTVRGVLGQGMDFDGTDDYIDVPETAGLDITGSEVTLAAWIKIADPSGGTAQRVISMPNNSGPGTEKYAFLLRNDQLEFWIRAGADDDNVLASYPDTDVWHHIVGVYDDPTMRIYIDGELITDGTHDTGGNIDANVAGNLQIGRYSSFYGQYFDGAIDDARVYNRALSDDEIKQLYRMGR